MIDMETQGPIWVVVGTRPEVIKQVPLLWALRRRFGAANVHLIGTGQHRELLEQALEHFGEGLQTNFSLMEPGRPLAATAGAILTRFEAEVRSVRPRLVVVQGDTITAAMAAISAFLSGIAVCHNEAGLRTYDVSQPFPEEASRRWIAPVAAMHLAPTTTARAALLREGVPDDAIAVTGNTGIDALHWTLRQSPPRGIEEFLAACDERRVKPVLVTAHRRENDPSRMDSWFSALRAFADRHADLMLVVPMHPNNAARPAAERHLGSFDRAWLTTAFDYASTCHLLGRCAFVVTDSGGIQEEAATLGVPAVVCRAVTERPDGVELGAARIASPEDESRVVAAMTWAAAVPDAARAAWRKAAVYGDGGAADRGAEFIAARLLDRAWPAGARDPAPR